MEEAHSKMGENHTEYDCQKCAACCVNLWATANFDLSVEELTESCTDSVEDIKLLKLIWTKVPDVEPDGGWWQYNCNQLDKVNGKYFCKIYETRPALCRLYDCNGEHYNDSSGSNHCVHKEDSNIAE